MYEVVLDTETTTINKGNVYDQRNQLCLLVIKVISPNYEQLLSFKKPWDVGRILEVLNGANLLIGFNLKFDLAWLRREFDYIPPPSMRIFDCQYAEFLFSNQTWKFPDLRTSLQNAGLTQKLDFIHLNYWSQGIDTLDIPMEELEEYCIGDVSSTHELYLYHVEKFKNEKQHQYRLFRLHMLDLPVLLEMEWNGLFYNKEKSLALAKEYEDKIKHIEIQLNNMVDFEINWNSNNEKSAVLYGGNVSRIFKAPIGHYKTGARAGEVKYKNVESIHTFPRLVEPLLLSRGKDAEEDLSVSEGVLRSLKPNKVTKKIIDLILERSKLEKMNGTYLIGLPKKMVDMNWGDTLHPQYNQCVAVTGRVASSNPNGQNIPGVGKQLIESRF